MASYMVGIGETNRKIGSQRQLAARMEHDTYNRLHTLQMPVFICGGRYDGIAPVINQEAMQKQIPQAHLELFEGGHLFLSQDPRAFNRIDAFLHGKLDD